VPLLCIQSSLIIESLLIVYYIIRVVDAGPARINVAISAEHAIRRDDNRSLQSGRGMRIPSPFHWFPNPYPLTSSFIQPIHNWTQCGTSTPTHSRPHLIQQSSCRQRPRSSSTHSTTRYRTSAVSCTVFFPPLYPPFLVPPTFPNVQL